ncbi:MAG: hypothetical protein AABX93_03760 [Nanoarchaeota archaeon]
MTSEYRLRTVLMDLDEECSTILTRNGQQISKYSVLPPEMQDLIVEYEKNNVRNIRDSNGKIKKLEVVISGDF